jgi:hypothetical protein
MLEATWRQYWADRQPAGSRPEMAAPSSLMERMATWPGITLKVIATSFCTVFFGTMFRSQNIADSLLILGRMLGFEMGGLTTGNVVFTPSYSFDDMLRPVVLASLAVIVGHMLGHYIFDKKSLRPRIPAWLEIAFYPVFVLLCVQLGAPDVQAFIYFVF